MKKVTLLATLLFAFTWLIADNSQDCWQSLEELYSEGRYLVLKLEGLPTLVEKMPGNLGSKTYCVINISPDGDWKLRSILGQQSDSTNILGKGDLLIVSKAKLKKNKFEVFTKTDQVMSFDVRGRTTFVGGNSTGTGIHANMFVFHFEKDEECSALIERIKTFFDPYANKEEINAPKEIKLGMTIEEVESILGPPSKKADLGKIIKYKYDDISITFEDGKVTAVDF